MVAIIRSFRFAASKRISTISPAPVQRSSFHFTALRAAGKESALSQFLPLTPTIPKNSSGRITYVVPFQDVPPKSPAMISFVEKSTWTEHNQRTA